MGLLLVVVGHLAGLHSTGSRNPLGLNRNLDKSPFHPYFSVKDLAMWVLVLCLLLCISLITP
jgi:ubiquinol-cytochrome c reductase cytochrome b subunit